MAHPHVEQFVGYFRQKVLCWKSRGVSRASIAINLVFFAAIWLLMPLERPAWKTFRENHRLYYPQIDFDAPKPLDCLRIIFQTVFLLIAKVPFGLPAHLSARARQYKTIIDLWATRAATVLDRLGNHLLAVAMADRGGNTARREIGFGSKLLLWVMGLFALGLAILCITQPFNVQGQIIFLSLMLLLAVGLARIKARLALMLLFVISIVVSGRYLWWRCTQTVNTDSMVGLVLSLILLGAEVYAFVVMVLGYFQVCWVLDRKPYPLPEDKSLWPHVDIFIPTYNEALEIIKPTVFAAQNLQWPAEKLHVYILDDGSRDSFERFAESIGVGYIKRQEHNHAKAGNINHAMGITSGDFITIFDCDHVPSSDFLLKTMGWLVKDEGVALVQTPHHFYSPDPFEKNLHLDRSIPIENSLFHDFIQKGNDTWNATMFCGSSAVMRRKALEQIGGIAVETVTEDAHTSLKLNRLGWSSVFIDTPVASGLSTDTLRAHIGQRIRWARGMVQIFRLDNPFLGKGLSLAQRLCFFNAMFHFFHGLPRLVFLMAPLPYMFANIYVIYATAGAIFAYVLPHMIHSALTNQRLQRGYRYPFLGGVYETVLSWYILLPTFVALVMPHKGKFNVTAKGGTIDEKYLDWGITKPFLFLLILNLVGLGVGIYKALFVPDAELLTLAINLGWIAYNLMVLFASMQVAVEDVQKEVYPRVLLTTTVTLRTQEGQTIDCQTTQFSQTHLCLKLSQVVSGAIRLGDVVTVKMAQGAEFAAEVCLCEADGTVDLMMRFADLNEEREFNRYTFAREGIWTEQHAVTCDDRFMTGFFKLGRLAHEGMRSMIEFLPGHWQKVTQLLRWLHTFVPKMPAIKD